MFPVRFARRSATSPVLTWEPLRQLERVSRLFEACDGDSCGEGPRSFDVDVYENDDHFLIEANLPGVDRDAVDVTLEDGVLKVTVTSESGEQREGRNYHVQERYRGSYSRAFRLPTDVDAQKVGASLADGVLTITLNRSETAKPRKIEVSSN